MSKPNYVLRGVLAITLATGITVLLAGLPRGGSAHDEDREMAAGLLEQGEIRPLDELLAKAQALHPGRVLEAELESKRGRHYYEIEILGGDGVVWEMKYDAATGELAEEEQED